MQSQITFAAGYLAVFLMPALLALGVWAHRPYLAFGTALLMFPLARAVFGGFDRTEPVLWDERIATVLHRLPVAYGGALLAAMLVVVVLLSLGWVDTAASAVGLGLSLWMTLLFATCPAHELVHRRNRVEASTGWLIAGLAGYPALGLEHLTHHGRYGDTQNAEWPRVTESVWHFAARRMRRVNFEAWTLLLQGDRRSTLARRQLIAAMVVTVLMATAFTVAAGPTGLFAYAGAVLGVHFGFQVITYLQHWGLGDDSVDGSAQKQLAWEDDCRFQAWITLHISFHQAHHSASRVPYYRVVLEPDSPRQPAGYVLLMLLCLFPGLWRRLMRPVLDEWKRHPRQVLSPGRRLTCFSLYRGRTTAA
ncbi:MAG: fatty acid desaturase [Burkholderiaceae bacterium]|nr:fatty acid desaturase [Burkholderiaceae bacterium]